MTAGLVNVPFKINICEPQKRQQQQQQPNKSFKTFFSPADSELYICCSFSVTHHLFSNFSIFSDIFSSLRACVKITKMHHECVRRWTWTLFILYINILAKRYVFSIFSLFHFEIQCISHFHHFHKTFFCSFFFILIFLFFTRRVLNARRFMCIVSCCQKVERHDANQQNKYTLKWKKIQEIVFSRRMKKNKFCWNVHEKACQLFSPFSVLL